MPRSINLYVQCWVRDGDASKTTHQQFFLEAARFFCQVVEPANRGLDQHVQGGCALLTSALHGALFLSCVSGISNWHWLVSSWLTGWMAAGWPACLSAMSATLDAPISACRRTKISGDKHMENTANALQSANIFVWLMFPVFWSCLFNLPFLIVYLSQPSSPFSKLEWFHLLWSCNITESTVLFNSFSTVYCFPFISLHPHSLLNAPYLYWLTPSALVSPPLSGRLPSLFMESRCVV